MNLDGNLRDNSQLESVDYMKSFHFALRIVIFFVFLFERGGGVSCCFGLYIHIYYKTNPPFFVLLIRWMTFLFPSCYTFNFFYVYTYDSLIEEDEFNRYVCLSVCQVGRGFLVACVEYGSELISWTRELHYYIIA